MAIKRKGKAPAKSKVEESEAAIGEAISAVFMGKAKLTISVKRRLANGDEVFIAPGIELDGPSEDLDATTAEVTSRVNAWMDELLEAYPDSDPIDDEDEEEEADDEDGDDDEADAEDGEEDELTEDDINGMKLADLKKLAKEYEIELESKKVADVRAEMIEALFDDEEEGDEEGDEEEDEDGDDEEEGDAYTEEELEELDLKDLQEICESWELEGPTIKKGTKLGAKKAKYIAYILEAQEEE